MPRVAGADPGTSSLDLLVWEDGRVLDQCRFSPEELRADPAAPVRWLRQRGPYALVAGPSGYGLPLVRAADCGEREWNLMTLVRPDERGHSQGVAKFGTLVRALADAGLPVLFLPGVIHLSTVPAHRKINRIDLGTADKLCVAALALYQAARQTGGDYAACDFCLVELGSAFTACMVVQGGRVVDGLGGSCGPPGWQSPGAWDGELAYLLSPLAKGDLFAGGLNAVLEEGPARELFRESLLRAVAGLQAVTPFGKIILSGRLLEDRPAWAAPLEGELERFGRVARLESMPGAWVKHAAQGAALLADGLAGGPAAGLVEHLALGGSGGTVLDWIRHPRGAELRAAFGC